MKGTKKERELYQAMRNWITSWLSAAPDKRVEWQLNQLDSSKKT